MSTPSLPGAGPVRDNAEARRFETEVEGRLAIATYVQRGDVLIITHTETPPALRGRGVASHLVAGALRLIRDRGQRVAAGCSFVADYLAQHPEWHDIEARR
jgi:predicted GNAT family acetyltransferase